MMDGDDIMSNDIFMEEDNSNEPDDVIIVHMDIRETLRTLQKLVEQKLGVKLKSYKFWLQDAQELEPHKNLVDQCVRGEGLVQINVQIQTINQRINIVDVLKPTEAALAALTVDEANNHIDEQTLKDDAAQYTTFKHTEKDLTYKHTKAHKGIDVATQEAHDVQVDDVDHSHKTPINSSSADNEKPVLNWVLDNKFKKEQARLKIPEDPNEWTVPQVKHWFQWAVQQFDLIDANATDWAINGRELCSLTHEKFRKKMPIDPGNVFWTHLQLLKECKFVSVVHKAAENALSPESGQEEKRGGKISSTAQLKGNINLKELKIMRKSTFHSAKNYVPSGGVDFSANSSSNSSNCANSPYGVGSGNNGQVQLWQFLLEILTEREHRDIIQWVGTDGEFRLTDPERVARLWGEKKNKPAMNYEKLSRALRYYYDGDMISKVPGKRFAYKFDCDLKLLIGYDAAELTQLVNEPYMNESVYLEHMKIKTDE